MKSREFLNLLLVLIISIAFAILSMSIDFIDRIYNHFYAYNSLPIFKFLVKVIFLWLIGLLWMTYRRWKKALRRQSELEDIISSISPDVFMVVDRHRNIIMCNDSVKRIFGYEVDEVINKKTDLLYFDGRSELSHKQEIYDTLETIGFHTGLATGKKKNGNIIDLEIVAAKLSGRDGAVLLVRDISERKKFEESLKKSEERYHDLIESANDAVISINRDAIIVTVNKKTEEMYGYSRGELLGKSVFLLVPPDRREQQKKALEKFKTRDGLEKFSKTLETRGFKKDGKEFPVETSMFSSEIHGDYILTSFVRDITDRKKMEYKLSQSEKLKSLGELAGGIAHDFNNVLAVILGRSQLLKKIVYSPTGTRERRKSVIELKSGLEVIEKASLDGAETVRRIQEFSRRRDDDKYFTSVDLNEVMNDALDFTRLRWKDDAESQEITFYIQKELSPLPPTRGNATELREVFTNLINNAIDAMPQGGSIKIKTFKEDSQISIRIEDTGAGIPKAISDMVFDPFFTTKGVKYSGLGLSVSYGIIHRHRGTIIVDSVEGQGTTFIVKLPISEKAAKREDEKSISDKQRKARILIIEDEEDVRYLLSDILIDSGHEVETVSDGSKGIKLFKKEKFDLVFTDLGMPEMSGWEVAKKIKGIDKKVPVFLVTGWNVEQKESKMRKSGVDLIVKKPFKVDQIINVVQEGMILRDRFKAA